MSAWLVLGTAPQLSQAGAGLPPRKPVQSYMPQMSGTMGPGMMGPAIDEEERARLDAERAQQEALYGY